MPHRNGRIMPEASETERIAWGQILNPETRRDSIFSRQTTEPDPELDLNEDEEIFDIEDADEEINVQIYGEDDVSEDSFDSMETPIAEPVTRRHINYSDFLMNLSSSNSRTRTRVRSTGFTVPSQPISGNIEVEEMATVASTFGMRASYPTIEDHPLIVGTNLAGVEIELEKLGEVSHPRFQYWASKEDGSLRNGGVEYVCSSPWGGRDLYNAAIEIDSFLFNNHPDESWRCSTHVHIDVRDMTTEEVKKMILAYLFYERPLFHCSGFHRYRNNFCVALGFAQDFINILSEIWHSDNFLAEAANRWNKYTAINLLPMNSFGSIEFRISEAKWRKGKLIRLVNRFLSLKEVAKGFTGTDEEFLQMLTSTPIEKVIRKGLPKNFPDFSRDLSIGHKLCNDIISRKKLRSRTVTILTPNLEESVPSRVYSMAQSSYHTAGWSHIKSCLESRTDFRLPDSKPRAATFEWVGQIQSIISEMGEMFDSAWFFRDRQILDNYREWYNNQ